MNLRRIDMKKHQFGKAQRSSLSEMQKRLAQQDWQWPACQLTEYAYAEREKRI